MKYTTVSPPEFRFHLTLQLDASIIVLIRSTIPAFFVRFSYLAKGIAESLTLINTDCPAYNMLQAFNP